MQSRSASLSAERRIPAINLMLLSHDLQMSDRASPSGRAACSGDMYVRALTHPPSRLAAPPWFRLCDRSMLAFLLVSLGNPLSRATFTYPSGRSMMSPVYVAVHDPAIIARQQG